MTFSRRDFLTAAALASASVALKGQNTPTAVALATPKPATGAKQNIIICAANGYNYLDRGYDLLRSGGDTLDAVNLVIRGPEDDPNDSSVGLGGLPNEEGVVELDASCMHGPTRRCGAVAGVRNIKNVSLLAKTVMERTGHVMLVGEGAERFAVAHGFPRENLLTDESRKTWLLWKESMSMEDWWGPGLSDPNYKLPDDTGHTSLYQERVQRLNDIAAEIGIVPELRAMAVEQVMHPPTGTINCSALNEKGEMSSATTTSGLAWKIPGRAGDSPIIGAGCYCDQDVGAAGATGNGEENIRVAGAHTIVENMRHGMEPVEAGLDALRRIARNYNNDQRKLRYTSMVYYVLRNDGAHAGVTLWSGERPRRYAVHDGERHYENCVALLQGTPLGFPPIPRR